MASADSVLKVKFEVFRIADICTSYLRESDLSRLTIRASFPFIVAENNDTGATFMYVPMSGSLNDDLNEIMTTLKGIGASSEMISIFCELRKKNIPFVRFDPDGGNIEGMPMVFEI